MPYLSIWIFDWWLCWAKPSCVSSGLHLRLVLWGDAYGCQPGYKKILTAESQITSCARNLTLIKWSHVLYLWRIRPPCPTYIVEFKVKCDFFLQVKVNHLSICLLAFADQMCMMLCHDHDISSKKCMYVNAPIEQGVWLLFLFECYKILIYTFNCVPISIFQHLINFLNKSMMSEIFLFYRKTWHHVRGFIWYP